MLCYVMYNEEVILNTFKGCYTYTLHWVKGSIMLMIYFASHIRVNLWTFNVHL